MDIIREKTHFRDILVDPVRYFKDPRDVLAEPHLTTVQKREILERWKDDSMQLMRAAEENMGGGEEHQLRAVERALAQIAGKKAS